MALRQATIMTLAAALLLAGCGGGASQSQVGTAPTPTEPTPTPTPTPIPSKPKVICTAGTWQASVSSTMPAVQLETAHFALRWKTGDVTAAAAQAAADHLEHVWDVYIGAIGFPEPYCNAATKYKVNVHIDPKFGLNGGVDGDGYMGIWIGPLALADKFGLAHEFTHSLQGSTKGMQSSVYVGWLWESHANWMALQLPEFRSTVHCSELLVNAPHLYYGSTRDRYCNWQFWEYLKDQYGYSIINDIWARSPKPGDPGQSTADPFSVLMANQGWSVSQLNDQFGQWAMHNVNWDYTNPDGSDQGAVYRAAYGTYDPQGGGRSVRTTVLDPIDLANRRFAVPPGWAPQRWGYNIVRLIPDAGATSITVTFRGVVQANSAVAALPGLSNEPATIPMPNSDWRWGVVAVDAAGQSRYSPLQHGADGQVTFALKPGDKSVFMTVVGAPTEIQKIQWDQPYYSIYRFPWMVQLAGAYPQGFEPGAAPPVTGAHRHGNGGGWIAPGAMVDATAYVGPYAKVLSGSVLGNARIEDHAVVDGGTVRGNAIISALTVVSGDTVLTDNARAGTVFMPLGFFEKGIVLSGTAQVIGDVEQRGGASFSSGVYYGVVIPTDANNPKHGSNLTAAVPEITAAPNYVWRP